MEELLAHLLFSHPEHQGWGRVRGAGRGLVGTFLPQVGTGRRLHWLAPGSHSWAMWLAAKLLGCGCQMWEALTLPLLLLSPPRFSHFLFLVVLIPFHPFSLCLLSLPPPSFFHFVLLLFPISPLYFICKNIPSLFPCPLISSRLFLLALPSQCCSADKPAYPICSPSPLTRAHQCLPNGSGDTDHPDAAPQAFGLRNEGCGQVWEALV